MRGNNGFAWRSISEKANKKKKGGGDGGGDGGEDQDDLHQPTATRRALDSDSRKHRDRPE